MNPFEGSVRDKSAKVFVHEKGRTYFHRDTERAVFFVLTGIMLVLGVLSRLGLL
ncbi:MAG: hypothetical protein JEZ02_08635 [Desulfatibacillum sp.]|nr:hypothetical protein [Desulfatibacillum sp.]